MNRRVLIATLVVSMITANFAECATFNVTTPAEFQTALTTAQANGENDTINVAAGTYNVGTALTYSTTENFDLTITGAGSATTILDGGNTVQIMRLTGDGNGDITVSGITFQHGRVSDLAGFGAGLFTNNSANGSTTVDQCVATNCTAIRNTAGAWLGAVNGDITVTNSSFTHNSCDEGTADDGCGLYLYFDSPTAAGNAIVRNNDISYNTLNHNPSPVGNCDGAGMMIYHLGTSAAAPSVTVENNIVSNNLSYEGAGGASIHVLHQQANITFSGNTFSDNTAGPLPSGVTIQISGGGLQFYTDGGTMVINNNKFLNNRNLDPYGLGGGLCIDNLPSGTLQMVGNVFAGNQTAGIGGGAIINLQNGVTSANIIENLFVNNQAGIGASEGSGGGLSLGSAIDVNLINNTFYNNTADDAGGMSYYAEAVADTASLFNEVYRGNTPNSIGVFGTGPVAATYSNIDSGTGQPYFGTGCIDTDPLFFNTASPQGADGIYATIDDGLHLTALSPSFNTGSTAAVPPALTLDIAGQARTQGGTVDMGAYEGVAGTPTAYNLTMAVAPAGSGTTTPAAGTHSLTSPSAIAAAANAGYAFVNWTVTAGTATVLAPNSESTSATFSTDCTITANFVEIPATATLTIAASPLAGGTTNPAVGAHPDQATQVPIAIVATPAEGYSFINWTKTGSVTIANSASATTTATLLNNATVIANFAPNPTTVRITYGSFLTITPDELGMPEGSTFGGKPSPSIAYQNITKTPPPDKTAKLTAVFDRENPDAFDCIWSKKIVLFNKKEILPSQTAADYIPLVQETSMSCPLSVRAKPAGGDTETYLYGDTSLVPPEITGVFSDNEYTVPIASAAANATVYVEGNWFGTSAPKVWLEYQEAKAPGNVVKTKTCKVLKPYVYLDYKQKPSCMDLTSATGLSRMAVQLPRSFPADWNTVSTNHNIVIDNGIGRATIDFTTE